MTWCVDFSPVGLNTEGLVDRLGRAALNLALLNPSGAVTELYDAARGLDDDTLTAAQRAAHLWRQVLAMAAMRAAPRAGVALDTKDGRDALKRLLREIGEASPGAAYDESHLIAPETFAPCARFLDTAPDMLAGLAPAPAAPDRAAMVDDLRLSLDLVADKRPERGEPARGVPKRGEPSRGQPEQSGLARGKLGRSGSS